MRTVTVSSSFSPPRPTVDDVLAEAARADCHRLGGLNNSHLFLTVLETGKAKTRTTVDVVCGEDPLPGLQMKVSSWNHPYGGEQRKK